MTCAVGVQVILPAVDGGCGFLSRNEYNTVRTAAGEHDAGGAK